MERGYCLLHFQAAAIAAHRTGADQRKSWRRIMFKKSKIGLIAAVAALAFASPALAQSFNPDYGTGNELSAHFQDNGQLVSGTAGQRGTQVVSRQSGMNAYAMVGRSAPADDAGVSATATGGGSAGYNQHLLFDGSAATAD
jgi:hypothetical protein